MRKNLFFLVAVFCFALTGCRTLNPSIMFKTENDENYKSQPTIANAEYRISPNDFIAVSVYTNDGFKLIDVTTNTSSLNDLTSSAGNSTNANQYVVDIDGNVKLPIIGKTNLLGMTTREAEKLLEQQYAVYYTKPFVTVKVTNRRVLVFPGEGGAGKVVTLTNENTTLIEALALAGGISVNGKAYKVKLIRGDYRNPQVQIIDLSTIDGMKQTNLLLQANDIIYVEPTKRVSQGLLAQISPYVGIVTSLVSVVLAYNILKNQ
ncbi:MAG: polysaccharide biosynthesis/export family protein [Bacteroidetes bacterium]|nr:polysaccharide biosynthesis/export family protein [Bacteroidota bacterium]